MNFVCSCHRNKDMINCLQSEKRVIFCIPPLPACYVKLIFNQLICHKYLRGIGCDAVLTGVVKITPEAYAVDVLCKVARVTLLKQVSNDIDKNVSRD